MISDTLFYDKLNLLDQVNSSSQLLQGMFNLNQAAGRDETKKFISLIEEMLERRILIEDFVEANKLRELLKDNKLYRGITIQKDTLAEIETLKLDEFRVLLPDTDQD